MHSLLKPEFPRLSSLSSHICKNEGKAGGGTADLVRGLVFLSGVSTSPKQEHSHDAQQLAGVSWCRVLSAEKRCTDAEEYHRLIFPNILFIRKWIIVGNYALLS